MKKAKILLCLAVVLLVGALVSVAAFANGDPADTDPIRAYDRAELEAAVSAADEGKYADASVYPWALFTSTDGENFTFHSAYKIYSLNVDNIVTVDGSTSRSAISTIQSIANKDNQTIVLLLRSDYKMKTKETAVAADVVSKSASTHVNNNSAVTITTGEDGKAVYSGGTLIEESSRYSYTHLFDSGNYNLANSRGTLIYDLGEFTLTTGDSSLISLQNKSTNTNTFNIKFYEGTIAGNNKTLFNTYNNYKANMASAEAAANNPKTYNFEFVGTNVSAVSMSEPLFTNGGSASVTSSGTVYEFLQATDMNIKFIDCNVNIGYKADNSYIAFNNSTGTAGEMTVTFENCELCAWSNNAFANKATVTVTGGTVQNEDGLIPPAYTDANEYPFVIFIDGAFAAAKKYWVCNNSGGKAQSDSALGYANDRGGKDVDIELRRNYEMSQATGNDSFHNLGQASWASVTLDLAGYTLACGNVPLINHNLKDGAARTQTFTIVNGVITSAGTITTSPLISVSCARNASNTSMTYYFNEVEFRNLSGAILSSNGITAVTNPYTINVNIGTKCSIDTKANTPVTLFDLSGATNTVVDFNISIAEETEILGKHEDVELYKLAENEALTFANPEKWNKFIATSMGQTMVKFTEGVTFPASNELRFIKLATGETAEPGSEMEPNVHYMQVEMQMLEGASIRVNAPTGMRFETVIGEEMFAFLKNAGYNPVVGTLIAPTDHLEAAGSIDEVSFLDLVSDLSTATASEGVYTFYAAISEILPQNYTRSFSAVSYLKYTVDGQEVVVYFDDQMSTRSVYDVACRALKDYTAGTAQYATVKSFIDSVVTLDADCNVLAPAGATGYTAPYTVSYEGGVLTITEGGATVTTIVINGVAYTRGFTSVDGVITVNYTAPAAE